MARTGITITTDTLEALNDARIDMFLDAGHVLTIDGRLMFLLGIWRAVRDTEQGAEACQTVAGNLARARVGRDRRCRT